MAQICDCNVGLSNTGRPGCVPIQAVTSSVIVVPLEDNDGNKNGIDLAALPVWEDLINEPDASRRWFPLPPFENVEQPKADPLTEEASSGRTAFLRDGKRSFTGELWEEDSSPEFLGVLQNMRCVDFGIFYVDTDGSLIGSYDAAANYLYPVPVDNASWIPTLMPTTDTTVNKIMLTFDIDRLFDESTLKLLTAQEAGQNFTELSGLIDVLFANAAGSAGTDTITFDAFFKYGTALNPIKYIGATLVADWTVTNNTTVAVIVPTLVTENPDGTYELTFNDLDINLNDNVTVEVNKNGFEGSFDVVVGA